MAKKPTSATTSGEKQYVLYFRVSTKKQGESGLGLEAQRAYIDHYYAGKPILAEFTDVRSGKTIAKWPELMKALALCKKEGATLVVAKIDRLSRNTENALYIYKELNERLESCDIPNLDKFTLTLFMAIADRERELISIRTRQALEARRNRLGEWRSSGPNEKKAAASVLGVRINKEMAADNDNNRRATSMAEMMQSVGKNLSEIASELNRAGFTTARGCSFQATQVMRLLQRSKLLAN
ncbi:recombinase family protein [Spirosoma pulveris]